MWKNIKQKKINFKGSAIVYALVIMAVVLILLTSIIRYVASQMKFSANRVEKERAFQVAEAGVYYYRWYLAHETAGMTTQQLGTFWATALGVGGADEVEYKDPETGEGIGHYKIEVTIPNPSSTIAIAKVTGWTDKAPATKRIVQVRFRRPSWSEYMFLVDAFVNFGTGSEVFGKVHSNIGVRFDGIAHDSVTSLVPSFDDPTHSDHNLEFGVHTHRNIPPATGVNDSFRPQEAPPNTVSNRSGPGDAFQGGRQFPVSVGGFNDVLTDLDNMEDVANGESLGGGQSGTFGGGDTYGRRIILKPDGYFDICRVRLYDTATLAIASTNGYRNNANNGNCSSCSGSCLSTYPIPNNGVIFVKNNVWVEGTVNNRRVTIVSSNLNSALSNIYLGINNLLYTITTGTNPDTIGLVARSHVQIIRNCQSDLVIDGALLAQSGKVWRSNYSDSKSKLVINGAIASFLQTGFNYGSSYGFNTRQYNFDKNLVDFPPPYFPTKTEYAIDLWEEI
jgi:hypothetical protein